MLDHIKLKFNFDKNIVINLKKLFGLALPCMNRDCCRSFCCWEAIALTRRQTRWTPNQNCPGPNLPKRFWALFGASPLCLTVHNLKKQWEIKKIKKIFHFTIHFIATINIEINHSLMEAKKPHTKKPHKHTDNYIQYSHQINIDKLLT